MKINCKMDVNEELQDYRKKMEKDIKSDADFQTYLKEKNITPDFFTSYLSLIHSCKIERENCKKCAKLEDCKNDNEGFYCDLTVEGDFIKKSYCPCKYYISRLKYLNSFVRCDIKLDDSLTLDYLKSILPNNEKRLLAYEALKNRILGEKRWLYIMGQTKSDKTRFALAFVNDYLKVYPNDKIAFVDFSKVVSDMSEIVFARKEEFKENMQQLVDCDVLVIDDFGSGYINNVIRDSFILPLLSERNKLGKMIIFTSRYSIKDAATLIAGQTKMLINQIGGEISVQSDKVLLLHELM